LNGWASSAQQVTGVLLSWHVGLHTGRYGLGWYVLTGHVETGFVTYAE